MTLARVNRNKGYYEPDFFGGVLDTFLNGGEVVANKKSVPVNVRETDQAFEIQFSLAGYDKEDVAINVEKHVLTVTGTERKAEEEAGKYTRKEFELKGFERSFKLPEIVEEEKIEAGFKNGILSITVPKKEPVKPVSIQIDVK